MLSSAGSVVSGRIFIALPLCFVLCGACFYRNTCYISLVLGVDFLGVICMFSCFQNLYGLHDLPRSRTWLLDYCRVDFSSEVFGLLFWTNQHLCLKEIFLALSYFTVGPLQTHFLLYFQNYNLMIEVMVTKYSHVMNKWMCELHLLSFHVFPASRSILQTFVRENMICYVHALEKCVCFLIFFFLFLFCVCACATRNIDCSRKLKNVSTWPGVFFFVWFTLYLAWARTVKTLYSWVSLRGPEYKSNWVVLET